MRPLKSFAAVPLLLVVSGVGQAAPAWYECPQSIPEASVRVSEPQPGWKPFVSSPLYLNSAAPADGPPERLGILRGQEVKTTKAGWTHKYSLAGPYPEGKWLRCDYGEYGQISLSKRLPDDIQECTVKGKKGEHAGESNIEVMCK